MNVTRLTGAEPAGSAVAVLHGGFEVVLPGPGKYVLGLTSPESETCLRSLMVPEGASRHAATVELAGAELKGTVVARATGGGISEAGVSAYPEGATLRAPADIVLAAGSIAFSDPAGRFRLRHLPAGKYRICVTAKGFLGGTPRAIEVAPDAAPAHVRLELEKAPPETFRIRLQDGQGRPLAGARCFLRDARGELVASVEPAPSGPDGIIEVHGLPAGGYESLVFHPLLAPTRARLRVSEGGGEAAVALGRGGRLEIEVADPRSEPYLDLEVEVLDAEGRDVLAERVPFLPGLARLIVDGLAGPLVLDPVTPGRYRLAVLRGERRLSEATATVSAGETARVRLAISGVAPGDR